jgi:hypothetical protein
MNTMSRLGVALAGLAVAALGSVGMAAATSREPARGVGTQGSETKHAVITSRVQRVILDGKAGEVKVTATGRSAITVIGDVTVQGR